MLIVKVMVCFLAVFRSEFYVGGLPTIQESPDNHDAGQSSRSGSNQRITNEPAAGSRPVELLDYAEHREEEEEEEEEQGGVRGGVKPEIKNGEGNFTDDIALLRFTCHSLSCDSLNTYESATENKNFRQEDDKTNGYSGTDQSNPILNESESRNERATTSYDFPTESKGVAVSSPGEPEMQRFSSVYTEQELNKKVSERKQEFKSDLSHYLSDVLHNVASRKISDTNQSSIEKSNAGNPDITRRSFDINESKSSDEIYGSSLADETNVPVPEEESKLLFPIENRERKSVNNIITWHQQSTNMRPTRTQHLVQNKRSPGEGSFLKLPGYGGRKSERIIEGRNRGSNRRQFTVNGPPPSRVQLQLAGLNPIQMNAAMAYRNRQIAQQALNIDLSRALYQFSPAEVQALRGVFDKVPPSTQNFKPIAPKRVAYVPPRIVYETKIVPTPFVPFETEQKTVQALSALLGQNPGKQLEGFNLILRKDQPKKIRINAGDPATASSLAKISGQGINDPVALGQAFVTPIPSMDINSGLGDGTFAFTQDGRDSNEEISDVIGGPFNHKIPDYPVPENINPQDDKFKSIPVIEESHETLGGQTSVEKELHPVWEGAEVPDIAEGENEGRHFVQNEEGKNYDDGYAAKYKFGYHVRDYESGNNFGHEESRDGIVTNGRYHVLLPDGRVQNVKYHVDEGGYHAKVSYQLNQSQ